ncbi:hypothetical protein QUF79_14575 [Fictibacillus enclensis]|uniref:hypothetical protein n=1 Tax=Fictibacillus enclensis TaxID=1017270 RepID=UPI00259FF317|nr:hypothetical protein [Fictibacillus enclensis]MDM5199243.1 hypothetical protein [Fictibacillus enclensis]
MSLQHEVESSIDNMRSEELKRIVTEVYLAIDRTKYPSESGISKEEAFELIDEILNSSIRVE